MHDYNVIYHRKVIGSIQADNDSDARITASALYLVSVQVARTKAPHSVAK